MPRANRCDEAPGTRRPYRWLSGWMPTWLWQCLPLSFRYLVVDAWREYEQSEEYRQWEYSRLRAEHPSWRLPAEMPSDYSNNLSCDWMSNVAFDYGGSDANV